MPAIVVFDTNILFSGTAWKGNPFQCVELARAGHIEAVSCTHIINELSEKLASKLNFSPDQVTDTLADYLSFLRLTNIPGTLEVVQRDPEDNAVLECAVISGAQFIITGDLDLLSLDKYSGVEIIRAADFIRRWRTGEIVR